MGHNHIIGRAEIYLSLVGLAAGGAKCERRTMNYRTLILSSIAMPVAVVLKLGTSRRWDRNRICGLCRTCRYPSRTGICYGAAGRQTPAVSPARASILADDLTMGEQSYSPWVLAA